MAFGRSISSVLACVIFLAASGCQPEVDRPGKVSDPSKTADAVPAVEPSPEIPVPAPEPVPERPTFHALDLALGRDHTCALDSVDARGKVWCWGSNSDGQLGRGPADAELPAGVPGLVEGVDQAVKVVAGASHSCALIEDGTVKCWGSRILKGLRNPIGSAPEQVDGLPSGSVLQIAAGASHTCARLVGGTVKCWGYNGSGQIGDGTKLPDEPLPLFHATPVQVVNLVDISHISAGYDHSCAVDTSSEVWCWGSNGYWQTGLPNSAQPAFVPLHTEPVAPSLVSMYPLGIRPPVSAGGSRTCVIDEFYRIACWGRKFMEAPWTEEEEVRTTVSYVNPSRSYLSVSTGDDHACVITLGGNVECWGSNSSGQLGDGSKAYRSKPTPVVGLDGSSMVRSGYRHTCALAFDNSVRCWGDNRSGQLGDGTLISRSVPGPVFQN